MEIRASFHAATLNLATNVAKSDEDSIGSGGVDKVIRQVQVCVITKKKIACVWFDLSRELKLLLDI